MMMSTSRIFENVRGIRRSDLKFEVVAVLIDESSLERAREGDERERENNKAAAR